MISPSSPGHVSSPLLPWQMIIVRSGRWFHGLPQQLSEQLLSMAQVRHLAPGEALYLRGDPPSGLYTVLRGTLSVSGSGDAAQTHSTLLTLFEPPVWFGELSLFEDTQRSHDVFATEPSCVLHIPHAPLQQWLAQHPEHWRSLALLLALKLRQSLTMLEEQLVLPAPQRLACRLVAMAEDYGLRIDCSQSRRMLNISQEQLARMLALSRQTTNQILRELQQRGLIRLYRGKLEVLDLPGLRANCHVPPATSLPAPSILG